VATPRRRALERFVRHRAALAGLVLLVVLVLVAIFAEQIGGADPYATDLANARSAPAAGHVLGTDPIGRDVFSRLVYGARVSLLVGLLAVGVSLVIGTVVGAVAGYSGGLVDAVAMRFTDVVMAYPTLLIILALVAIVGQDLKNIIVVIGLLGWPGIARLVRGSYLSLREDDYVLAARALGAPAGRIAMRHILPAVTGPLVVAATFGMASAILMEAGLSFLGVGVQPPASSWGNMLADAQSLTVLESMPWLWLPPGLAIVLAVLSINFVGDGLRDALDPRSLAGR
jgi:peptide/nickel transport system permease protein